MYTVEFEPDCCIITTLDESDAFEDVQVLLGEDMTVFITQHNDSLSEDAMIYMSYQQLLDLFAAMSSTEGMFRVKRIIS